ncbi:MAG: hypothetical protein U0271_45495 [Polyangiaceae bacterium]
MSGDAPLGDLRVFVVDCQATGAAPDKGSLLELGWGFVSPDGDLQSAEAHWVALPPHTTIPPMVRRLLGIELADRRVTVPEGEVLARLEAALAGEAHPIPTVIHFARFELSFLRDLYGRLSPSTEPPFETVCLHELARRLLPDLPRRSLRALAGFLGYSAPPARRVAVHVAATAHVYRQFVGELAKRGVHTWSELRAFTSETRAPKSRRINPLPRSFARTLPAGPGVYRFCRSNGDVLYVGKATSLRDRVASHLTRSKNTHERALEMLSQAQAVDATPTPTALEAALLECDEIKRLDPPYNVHLRRGLSRGGIAMPSPREDRGVWFSATTFDSATQARSSARPLGPFPSRTAVLSLGAIIRYFAGEADPALPGECLGVPPQWAPEPGLFDAAFRAFSAEVLRPRASRTARGTVLRSGHGLLLAGFKPEESDDDEPTGWDLPRVRRHLERALLRGVQLVRRARCLVLFSDAYVEFKDGSATSCVAFVGGDRVEPSAWSPAWSPWHTRQARFDTHRYDRVRVFITELKRLLTDPRSAILRASFAPARPASAAVALNQGALARLLRAA